MRQPITFCYRNLVFADDPDDPWALFRVETVSYPGRTAAAKRELLSQLAGLAAELETDFTLLRVSRSWSIEDYRAGARRLRDRDHCREDLYEAHVEGHAARLGGRQPSRPEVYLSVRLAPGADGDGWGHEVLAAAKRLAGLRDPRGLSGRRLDGLLDEERRVFGRVLDFLDADRATPADVQWLVRRAHCRGIGEPEVDGRWEPQALIVDDEDDVRVKPLEADVLRLFDAPIHVGPRALRIETERGASFQAVLAFGALPEAVRFPGRQAELLFAPLEAVEFPVDAAFAARFVSNERALRLIRRRIIDADNIFREESHGEHGPMADSYARPRLARELEEYLSSGSRPPLVKASITLTVAASSEDELEERVERLRRVYGRAPGLHRPLGDQLRLWVGHLPGQGSQVPDYDDYLLCEQFGAMVPTATCAVGPATGLYIGRTLSGAAQPVLFDLTEGSRTSRPPSVLMVGAPGAGKTIALQLLLYQAFLQGSRVIDIDPKGDHRLDRLPGVRDSLQVVELNDEDQFAGVLDPFRVAPTGTEADLAANFLIDVLPEPVDPHWQTEIHASVAKTLERAGEGATCSLVVQAMMRGSEHARAAGRALAIHGKAGLARLGFGAASNAAAELGAADVTIFRLRNLPRPAPGTHRGELTREERVGQAVMRLLTAFALRSMKQDPDRHKAVGFEESWFLTDDAAGRRLIEQLNRWGRSDFATPILVTHFVSDAEALDNLFGARFVFGMESEPEAAQALRIVRLDGDDPELRAQALAFRRGRCFLSDYDAHTAPVQLDPGADILAALDTTPGKRAPESDADPVAA